jgi:hypothetical protein
MSIEHRLKLNFDRYLNENFLYKKVYLLRDKFFQCRILLELLHLTYYRSDM